MSFPFGQYANLTVSSGTVDIVVAAGVSIDRVGIQGAPGMEFILNGETLTLGRNGCYEVETTIDSLEINKANVFIVDYHIKEE